MEESGGPLLRLGGSLQWLSSKPFLPAIYLVPGIGTPISLCPDHLFATSPFLRQLLPAGPLSSAYSLHLPDVKGSDVTSALQLLATGLTNPIQGLANFNRQMGAIWEIFDLLGVQINMSGGFEITETVAPVKSGVGNNRFRGLEEESEQRKNEKGNGSPVLRVPLRVEDEIWDGDSIPKSRLSECEAEQLQVETQHDGNCNGTRFYGDFENNNEAGNNKNNSGVIAELHGVSAARRKSVGKRKKELELQVGGVMGQESECSEQLDVAPSRKSRNRNCKTAVVKTKSPLLNEGPSQEESGEKLGHPFLCTFCGKRFGVRKYMNRHIRDQHSSRSNQSVECVCQQCGKVFSNKESLRKHTKRFHPIQGFPCKHDGCSEVSMSKSEATQHYRAQHVLVEDVGDSLAEKRTLCNPRTEIDGGSLNACKLCGKSFRERSSLNEHMKRCTARCSNNFSSEEDNVENSSSVMNQNRNWNPNLSGPEVEGDGSSLCTILSASTAILAIEESCHGQPHDARENEVEMFGSEDQGETAEASLSESAAPGEDEDESQYRTCPFCTKAVLSSNFDKHVRKHQPITRAIN